MREASAVCRETFHQDFKFTSVLVINVISDGSTSSKTEVVAWEGDLLQE